MFDAHSVNAENQHSGKTAKKRNSTCVFAFMHFWLFYSPEFQFQLVFMRSECEMNEFEHQNVKVFFRDCSSRKKWQNCVYAFFAAFHSRLRSFVFWCARSHTQNIWCLAEIAIVSLYKSTFFVLFPIFFLVRLVSLGLASFCYKHQTNGIQVKCITQQKKASMCSRIQQTNKWMRVVHRCRPIALYETQRIEKTGKSKCMYNLHPNKQ